MFYQICNVRMGLDWDSMEFMDPSPLLSFLHRFRNLRDLAVWLYRINWFMWDRRLGGIQFSSISLCYHQTVFYASQRGSLRSYLWLLWFSIQNFSISVALRSLAFDINFQDLRNPLHSSFLAFSLSLNSSDFLWHYQCDQEATLQSVPTYFLVYF